jgi:DNA polymerase alpha subunit B
MDKYEHIKHRLKYMKPFFLELLGLIDFKPVNYQSDITFASYGIITNLTGNKLTGDSIYLTSNIDESNNTAVRLNLDHLARCSLFPGQIISVEGKNTNGNEIVVEKIHCMPLLDINAISNNEIEKYAHAYEKSPLEIICVSGPYFSEDSDAFCTFFGNDPDILIMFGPFVDKPVSSSPREIFKDKILPKIEKWLSRSMTSKVILVPSTDDIITLGLYPQPPFDFIRENDRLILLSNPSLFYINEFLFGISSLDILLTVGSEEWYFDKKGIPEDDEDVCSTILFQGDRTSRLCHHIVFQRNFVSTFPMKHPISYSSPKDFDIDISPDFLILSSRLKHFSRVIGPTNVITLGIQPRIENKTMAKILIFKADKECVEGDTLQRT